MSTVLNLIVGSSAQDARNLTPDSTFSATAATHHMGKYSTTAIYYHGWKFTNVTIPKGATIVSAIMTFYVSNVNAGTTAKEIFYGEANDAPADFGNTTAGKPEGRAHTTASVAKNFATADWGTVGYNQTVDLKDILTELVNRTNWASGNNIVIVATDNGSSNTNYVGYATYDNASNKATKLDITYETSAIKAVNGLAKASVKTKNNLAIASVKSINGLS